MNIKMKLTATPEEGFLGIATNDDVPIIVGEGETNYLCGNCQNVIGKNLVKGQVSNIGAICPKCGWQNQFPEYKESKTGCTEKDCCK